jgi:hypothetical protein
VVDLRQVIEFFNDAAADLPDQFRRPERCLSPVLQERDAHAWGWGGRGGGWGWGGAALGLAAGALTGGALAAPYYGYGYGYGYPAYGYGYGYPAYGYGYGTGYGYAPTYGHGYGTGYGYAAYGYGYRSCSQITVPATVFVGGTALTAALMAAAVPMLTRRGQGVRFYTGRVFKTGHMPAGLPNLRL